MDSNKFLSFACDDIDHAKFIDEANGQLLDLIRDQTNRMSKSNVPFQILAEDYTNSQNELLALELNLKKDWPDGIDSKQFHWKADKGDEWKQRKIWKIITFKQQEYKRYAVLSEFVKYLQFKISTTNAGYRSLLLIRKANHSEVIKVIYECLNYSYFDLPYESFVAHFDDNHLMDATLPTKINWKGDIISLRALFDFLIQNQFMERPVEINKLISLHFKKDVSVASTLKSEMKFVKRISNVYRDVGYQDLMNLTLNDLNKVFDLSKDVSEVRLSNYFNRDFDRMARRVKYYRSNRMVKLFHQLLLMKHSPEKNK